MPPWLKDPQQPEEEDQQQSEGEDQQQAEGDDQQPSGKEQREQYDTMRGRRMGTANLLRQRQVDAGLRPAQEGPAVLSIYILTFLWGPTQAAQLDGFLEGKKHMKEYLQRGMEKAVKEAAVELQVRIYNDISTDFNVWAASLVRKTEIGEQESAAGHPSQAILTEPGDPPATPPPRRACMHADAATHLSEWRPLGENGQVMIRNYDVPLPELPLGAQYYGRQPRQ